MTSVPRRRKGVPGPILALFYTALLSAPLALAYWTGIESAGGWSEAANATGLVGCAMLLAQFVTSGRYEGLSGRIGIDVTMAFHKWAARILLVVVILHPILFQFPISFDRLDLFWTRLGAMLASPRYLSGTIALALVILAVVLALLRDRLPVPYEVWRASHGLVVLSAAWLAATHAIGVGTYSSEGPLAVLWPAFAVVATAALLGVHAIKTYRMHRSGWRVLSNRSVADGLWEVVLGPDGGKGVAYHAGQFAWVTFAPRRLLLLDHPFSIASSPAAGTNLTFIIKEAGDFTGRIGSIAPGTPAGIDAPHGSFTLEGLDADAVLLIAGGVGIAPILGILRDLAVRGDRRPLRLIYAARSPHEMIDPEEILAQTQNLDLDARFFVEEPEKGWRFQTGRVGEGELRSALATLEPSRVAAMICGPGVMMAAVSDTLMRLGVSPGLIRYERFDYAGVPPLAQGSPRDGRLLGDGPDGARRRHAVRSALKSTRRARGRSDPPGPLDPRRCAWRENPTARRP